MPDFSTLEDLEKFFGPTRPDLTDMQKWLALPDGLRFSADVTEGILVAHHPLYHRPLGEPWTEKVTDNFQKILNAFQKCVADGDWGMALILVSSPYRLGELLKYRDQIPADKLPAILCDSWMHTELPHQYPVQKIISLFLATGWFSDHDSDWRNSPPRPTVPLTLYRGMQKAAHWRNLSWTANPEQAEWFAKRWNSLGKSYVAEMTVPPEKLLAAFIGRGEAEYIVDIRGMEKPKIERIG